MPKVKMHVARKRRSMVLRYLVETAGADGCAVVSLRGIASATGLTLEQVRSCLGVLAREGYTVVVPRTNPDGGTAENAYFVTEKGRRALVRAPSTVQASCEEPCSS